MKYIYKAIDFLKAPEKSFDSVKKVKLSEAFRLMLVASVIFAVLSGILSPLYVQQIYSVGAFLLPMMVITIVVSYVGIILASTIWGIWLHLWAYIFGARKGLEQTMKCSYYGYSPYYLLGWIPVVSIIFMLWSLVLQGFGLKKLQGMTTEKAAISLVIAVVIPVIIIAALVMTFLTALMAGGAFGNLDAYMV